MECSTPAVSFDLFMDNYFTSFRLFCLLTSSIVTEGIKTFLFFQKKFLKEKEKILTSFKKAQKHTVLNLS